MTGPILLVLNVLRLKGFAEAEAIALCAGLPVDRVAAELESLSADDCVTHREGRVSGWSLTAVGRARHATMVADEVEALACRKDVDAAYRRFLEINTQLLALCTDWQLRTDLGDQVLNDHTDAAYDAGVIARLGAIDDAVQSVCADVSRYLPRFGGYGAWLAAARAKVEGGDNEWFTKPLIDSYHTVWFEMHEDLLSTLGIDRASEGSS